MSLTLHVFAPAKINLTLHVVGQGEDGYHHLVSLVAFADIGDHLALHAGPKMTLEVSGPFAAGVPEDQRNLAWRAAEYAGWSGKISLQKNLPHGAGLGGGSSDAGAILRVLECNRAGVELGADVPICRLGRTAVMRGIGDQISPAPEMPETHLLLVNSGQHLSTPTVFKALENKSNANMEELPQRWDDVHALTQWLQAQRNDLEAPAMRLSPQIEVMLDSLRQLPDVLLARMSGSGASCFAIFGTQEEAKHGAQLLQDAQPQWWIRTARLL